MPELPDVTVYRERLAARTVGRRLERIRLRSPFLLRTVDPPVSELAGRRIEGVERLGKQLVWVLEDERFLVIHLMVAGRLRWRPPMAAVPRRHGLAAFDVEVGTVVFTEASKKKRARLHLVRGREALAAFDRGALDPRCGDPARVGEVLRSENHTLKRSLTDPRLFDGIGGAYADEILHTAGLSPVTWTRRLDDGEVERLTVAMKEVLERWIQRLRDEVGEGFPDKVTAFHPAMAVHGRFGEACPVCGTEVQRIVYVGRETHYCPACQTGGRLLKDRALSQLLKGDWPRTIEELEALRKA